MMKDKLTKVDKRIEYAGVVIKRKAVNLSDDFIEDPGHKEHSTIEVQLTVQRKRNVRRTRPSSPVQSKPIGSFQLIDRSVVWDTILDRFENFVFGESVPRGTFQGRYRPYIVSGSGNEIIIKPDQEHDPLCAFLQQFELIKKEMASRTDIIDCSLSLFKRNTVPVCIIQAATYEISQLANDIIQLLGGIFYITVVMDNLRGPYANYNWEFDTFESSLWETLDWNGLQSDQLNPLLESLHTCATAPATDATILMGPQFNYASFIGTPDVSSPDKDGHWSTDLAMWVFYQDWALARSFSRIDTYTQVDTLRGYQVHYFAGELMKQSGFKASNDTDVALWHQHIQSPNSLRSGSLIYVPQIGGDPGDRRVGTVGPNVAALFPEHNFPPTWYLTCEHMFNYKILPSDDFPHFATRFVDKVYDNFGAERGVLLFFDRNRDMAVVDLYGCTDSSIQLNNSTSTNFDKWCDKDNVDQDLLALLKTEPHPAAYKSGAVTGITEGTVVTFGTEVIIKTKGLPPLNPAFLCIMPKPEPATWSNYWRGKKEFSVIGDSGAVAFVESATGQAHILGLLNGTLLSTGLRLVRMISHAHLLNQLQDLRDFIAANPIETNQRVDVNGTSNGEEETVV